MRAGAAPGSPSVGGRWRQAYLLAAFDLGHGTFVDDDLHGSETQTAQLTGDFLNDGRRQGAGIGWYRSQGWGRR